MMGREHLANIAHLPESQVVSLVDPNSGSFERAVQVHGGESQTFSNLRDALSGPEFDVVVIASPNNTHADVIHEALEHGKHVLVEKPLATTVQDCRKIERLVETRPGQVVAVGLEYRFMAPTAWLLDTVRAGELGNVRMMTIIEHRFPFLDKVGAWNRFNDNTGGTFVEKCCHFFDLMYQVFRTEPIAVLASSAETVNHRDERYDGRAPDILDNGYVIVEFDGGRRGMLELCMFAEGSRDEQYISVVGDKAKAEVRIPSNECSIGDRRTGSHGVQTKVVQSNAPHQGLHHGSSFEEHRHFRRALLGQDHELATPRDGTRSVAIGVAAQRSIAEGRRVTLEEVGYDD